MINSFWKYLNNKLLPALFAAALCAFLSGCGAGKASDEARPMATSAPQYNMNGSFSDYEEKATVEYDYGYEMPSAADGYASGTEDSAATPEYYADSGAGETSARPKIIMTGSVSLQSDGFDDAVNSLRILPSAFGGYIESSELSRYGGGERGFSVAMRVPRDNYEALKSAVETLGKVTSSSESSQDATSRYYDLERRVKTLRIEEERALAIIEKAQSVEDLLSLERRLSDIRADIDVYQTRMTSIDRLSDYSALSVSLTEVTPLEMKLVSDDLGGRMRQRFTSSVNATVRFFENALVFLAGAVIPVAVIGILAAAGAAGFRYRRKARGGEKESGEKESGNESTE